MTGQIRIHPLTIRKISIVIGRGEGPLLGLPYKIANNVGKLNAAITKPPIFLF